MEIHGIGALLLKIREEKGVAQKELALGLCTQRELSKIEADEKYLDTFLLDCLMSRLGKSADKLEYTVSGEEYEYLVQRAEIEDALEQGQYEVARGRLEEYEEVLKKGDVLHWQYIAMMRGFLALQERKDEEEYIRQLENSMEYTMPFWKKDNILSYKMAWLELGLYLLWVRKGKEKPEMLSITENILDYVDNQWDDEEEKVKIYPFAAVACCKGLLEQEEYQKAEAISRKAIKLLTKNNAISNLLELLKIRIEALEGMKENGVEVSDLERLIKQKMALEMVEEEYGYREGDLSIFTRIKREIYLDREIIQRNRKAKGMTQEELSDGICAQETLARIEQGRKAHNRNFVRLAERLSWTKKKLTNEIGAWDYSVLEKKHEIDWLMSRYQYKEAKEKLLEFPCPDTVEGRQFYLYKLAAVEMELEEKSPEEALKLFEEALTLTLQVESIEKIREYVLTKQEIGILNCIAISCAKQGKKDIAIEIYRNIIESHEKSKVMERFKAYGMLAILDNFAVYLEETNFFAESLEQCQKEIKLEFECRRMGEIAGILMNIACVYERQEVKVEEQKRLYWLAYYIAEIMENKLLKKTIGECLQVLYGEAVGVIEK